MRVLFWYCERMGWTPSLKTLDDAAEAAPDEIRQAVVAFVHVEPSDVQEASSAETKLVKNAKWLARKWDTESILLHSFAHLGEDKAPPDVARELLTRAEGRLVKASYSASQTPYGYFLDLELTAPGHPLARVYKAW